MTTLLADDAVAAAGRHVMTQAVQLAVGVSVKPLEPLLELPLLMAARPRAGIKTPSHDVCRDVCQLEAAHPGAGSKNGHVNNVCYRAERVSSLTKSPEQLGDHAFGRCVLVEHQKAVVDGASMALLELPCVLFS